MLKLRLSIYLMRGRDILCLPRVRVQVHGPKAPRT